MALQSSSSTAVNEPRKNPLPPPSNQSPDPVRSIAGAAGSVSTSGSSSATVQSQLPVVLSIAGYDPSAGAGVLADLKTFAALGVYGMASITALTVQSTQGVRKVVGVDPGTVTETLDCLAEDVRFAAIKVGMLGNASVTAAVFAWLEGQRGVPVVLDPVLKSSSGKDLLDSEGCGVLRQAGLARANWITPNLGELAVLTSEPIPENGEETEKDAGQLLRMAIELGNPELKIVVTGGHAKKPDDLLLVDGEFRWFPGEWVQTRSTHGTGCTFSSALAARIALGDGTFEAVQKAKDYVTGALRHSPRIGTGNGPLGHFWQGHRPG